MPINLYIEPQGMLPAQERALWAQVQHILATQHQIVLNLHLDAAAPTLAFRALPPQTTLSQALEVVSQVCAQVRAATNAARDVTTL
ncbi:MAG: hypothetical protein HC915_02125 [Anaerolineae bacterium]|nr:hypothetical protein [Anaerolineae bacterium]